ncbi:unnamed protein product, partial [Meganyctiphanes norvegica]
CNQKVILARSSHCCCCCCCCCCWHYCCCCGCCSYYWCWSSCCCRHSCCCGALRILAIVFIESKFIKMNIWVLLVTWFCRTLLVPSPVVAQAPSSCKFPFTYKGVSYRSCTKDGDPDGRLWCSTRTDRNGNHVGGGGHFTYCE